MLTGICYTMTLYKKFCPLLSCAINTMGLRTLGSQKKTKKMKNTTKINMKDMIINLLIGIAFGLFAYFALHSFFEYRKELTGINQSIETVEELSLPTITVCSQKVFKNVKNDTTTEMVLQNLNDYVYAWEDMFHGFFTLLASRFWNPPHEIFSNDLGLCYSLKNKNKANPTNHYLFYIFLPVGKKYQVCLFTPMSELLTCFLENVLTDFLKYLCRV